MTNGWTEGDIHLVNQVAHHDLWWAKGHLWTATNWALALLTALVGVGGLLLDYQSTSLVQTWPLVLLSTIVTLAATGYLARLHYDVLRARRIIAHLRELRPELDALDRSLPVQPAVPDTLRGLVFVGALVLAVSVALGISLYVFTKSCWLASGSVMVNMLAGVVFVWFAVKKVTGRG